VVNHIGIGRPSKGRVKGIKPKVAIVEIRNWCTKIEMW
jgi:hypothetical protein